MERAVEQYVLRNYVGELERLIYYVTSKSKDPMVSSLQTRLQNLKNNKVLVSKDVETLGADIEFQIKPPSWFTQSTNLCFRWSAESDASQCGGDVANDLCAKPNSMTPPYLDDTDDRYGGCRMEWGIFSSGVYPDWFNQVKMCYKYSPTGPNNWQQCNDGNPDEWCVKLNRFTPVYIDSTYQKEGGCVMQWKIIVPSNVPLWMKTAQFCYSWFPTGDTNQCGWGAPRDSCVFANEWTARYVDDTQGAPGGCRMSWGIKTLLT